MTHTLSTIDNWQLYSGMKPDDGQDVWYFFEVTGVSLGKYDPEGHTFYGAKGFLTGDVTHWLPARGDDAPVFINVDERRPEEAGRHFVIDKTTNEFRYAAYDPVTDIFYEHKAFGQLGDPIPTLAWAQTPDWPKGYERPKFADRIVKGR